MIPSKNQSKIFFNSFSKYALQIFFIQGTLSSDGSRSNFFCSGWVSHIWYAYGFINFPLKIPNFSIFALWIKKKYHRVGSKSTRVKAGSASYLRRAKSMLGLGQGPSLTPRLGIVLRQPWDKGYLEVPRIEPLTLRFPA